MSVDKYGRRSSYEIKVELLAHLESDGPSNRTLLMYKTHSNHVSVKRYLAELSNAGLVTDDGRRIQLTALGLATVKAAKQVVAVIGH